jgi:hypothetical protein
MGKAIPVTNDEEASCHEDVWGSGDIVPLYMTSAPDGVVGFTPVETAPVPTGGRLGGPRDCLDAVKRKTA